MNRIAISKRTALKMFFDVGYNTDLLLKIALIQVEALKQAANGYYYADDVVASIQEAESLLNN